MKLLLTSGGLTNQKIADALIGLIGKKPEDAKFVFVPTAMNVELGSKRWCIRDLQRILEQKFGSIDIVDVSAIPRALWQPRLETADIICFGGGSEQYLARVLEETGLKTLLPELLKTRVYMGISAGSMVAGQFLSPEFLKIVYPDDVPPEKPIVSLGFVETVFIPHLNNEFFPHVRKEKIELLAAMGSVPVYALDDYSALKIVDGQIEVVGGGEYIKV